MRTVPKVALPLTRFAVSPETAFFGSRLQRILPDSQCRRGLSSCRFCLSESTEDSADNSGTCAQFVSVPPFDEIDTRGWGVSPCGLLKDSRGFVSRGSRGDHGYLSRSIRGKQRLVHRVVAETFLQKEKRRLQRQWPGERLDVDHIDGKRQHNAVTNLQWMTRKDHAKKTAAGLVRPRPLNAGGRAVLAVNVKTGEERRFPTVAAFTQFVGIFGATMRRKRWGPIKGWGVFREAPERVEGERFRRLAFLDETVGRTVQAYVSNQGRVRHENGRVTWGVDNGNSKYKRVGVGGRGNSNFLVHRLVAEVFHSRQKAKLIAEGHPAESLQVDHIDGCPTNNKAENLQWMTPSMHARKTAEMTRIKRQHRTE
uniref:HNH nuclease domain-containing protein n=1 Tax=Chromera velia CCMP2878 TaxID=1169474 RepID=A0A0G4I3T0_9ALVE|eukprot:Cvel_10696.t1-p1 / transcript=Cvel_10696.t1 / gene=Cvel_10696 / organism=Chromera_velia_CCMP2878 / gene_product=Uncharacterized HNH endonuclease L247, putative / transcript_product=Uncharacterized HNH endonuclease L247, putative / location=Cvel_scaffold650:59639-60958(-) / protein_length=367 / sequence_SO=supercontig / SO=protein_coding / is_pseudo=false